MSEGIPFARAVGNRKLSDLSANELRAKLILAGVEIPREVSTKEELIALVKRYA